MRPLFEPQPVNDQFGDPCLYVDFRDELYPYVAQIDGDRYHSALLDRETDALQTAALVEAGYVVDRIRAHDVWHEARDVCARVRAGRARAQAAVTARTVQPIAPETARNA